jgi:hypothetical protein
MPRRLIGAAVTTDAGAASWPGRRNAGRPGSPGCCGGAGWPGGRVGARPAGAGRAAGGPAAPAMACRGAADWNAGRGPADGDAGRSDCTRGGRPANGAGVRGTGEEPVGAGPGVADSTGAPAGARTSATIAKPPGAGRTAPPSASSPNTITWLPGTAAGSPASTRTATAAPCREATITVTSPAAETDSTRPARRTSAKLMASSVTRASGIKHSRAECYTARHLPATAAMVAFLLGASRARARRHEQLPCGRMPGGTAHEVNAFCIRTA